MRNPDGYYSQGEYVSFFGRDHADVSIEDALEIRVIANEIALENGIKVKLRSGKSEKRLGSTIALPKIIWEEAFQNLKK